MLKINKILKIYAYCLCIASMSAAFGGPVSPALELNEVTPIKTIEINEASCYKIDIKSSLALENKLEQIKIPSSAFKSKFEQLNIKTDSSYMKIYEQYLLTKDLDDMVQITNLQTGETSSLPNTQHATHVAIIKDVIYTIVPNENETFYVLETYNLKTQTRQSQDLFLPEHYDGIIDMIAVESYLYVFIHKYIIIYDTKTQQVIKTMDLSADMQKITPITNHENTCIHHVFLANKRIYLIANSIYSKESIISLDISKPLDPQIINITPLQAIQNTDISHIVVDKGYMYIVFSNSKLLILKLEKDRPKLVSMTQLPKLSLNNEQYQQFKDKIPIVINGDLLYFNALQEGPLRCNTCMINIKNKEHPVLLLKCDKSLEPNDSHEPYDLLKLYGINNPNCIIASGGILYILDKYTLDKQVRLALISDGLSFRSQLAKIKSRTKEARIVKHACAAMIKAQVKMVNLITKPHEVNLE